MLFSILLLFLSIMIGLAARTNKSIREIFAPRNVTFVIMSKDGKTGRRFIFRKGKYSSDKMLKDYDMALVFESTNIGFKTLAFGGPTGLQTAINNYQLKVAGNAQLYNLFGLLIAVSTGMWKRK